MTFRLVTLALASSAFVVGVTASAQGLRATTAAPVALKSAAASVSTPADYIVALVNSEPITNSEVSAGARRLAQQLTQQHQSVPAQHELVSVVLERLINEKVQLQEARDSGIRADQAAIDQAERNIAQQNQMDVAELRRQIALDGISLNQFRAQLQDQIALSRLRERDVQAKVRVSDLEVDQYMLQQQSTPDPAAQQINLAQILVVVPEAASPVQLETLRAKAQGAWERARAGEDFSSLVREFSANNTASASGGELGLRSVERYPALFVQATEKLEVGQVSALLRSEAGFHILKVLDKQNSGLPAMAVTQSRARHILLRPGPQLSEAQARSRLLDFRQRVLAGKADFATLAREHSQDGSAAQGGDLGWSNPGMFVPEFEAVLNTLEPGQISAPLLSRFGVHLIQLQERRKASLNPQEQREAVRKLLHDKKLDERYARWAQDLRGRAFVELREPPQ